MKTTRLIPLNLPAWYVVFCFSILSMLALENGNELTETQAKPCRPPHRPPLWEGWHSGTEPTYFVYVSSKTSERRLFSHTHFGHSEIPQSISCFCWRRSICTLPHFLKTFLTNVVIPSFPINFPKRLWE